MTTRTALAFLCLAVATAVSVAQEPANHAKRPAVLIINGMGCFPMRYGDFDYLQRLNQHGFQIDSHFFAEEPPRPITWDLLKRYNCLVILDLPPDEQDTENWATMTWGKTPPYKKEMQALLDAYLKQGGGIFFMPTLWDWGFRATQNSRSIWNVGAHGCRLSRCKIRPPSPSILATRLRLFTRRRSPNRLSAMA